jgi:tripartite-type tricarboxylate transporter receptor subunit TctC
VRSGWRALALAGALAYQAAQAQFFPAKPVHLIVPTAPGGSIDILARLFSQHLQPLWGQSVIVEYKPGASNAVGTDFVAKSAPDGHTVGMVVTAHVINPSIRRLPFDTVKDLAGVTMTAVSNILISASPAFPANSLADLIALAKKEPGRLSYASPGSGSAMHLAAELLKSRAAIDILHVPFKGSGPAYSEVISGRIELLIDPLYASMAYVKAGKLKALAVTGAKRAPTAPDIPSVAETLPDFNVLSINGVVVPAATPRTVLRKLNADFVKALRLPEFSSRLGEMGLEPVGNSPEEFDATIRAEIENWANVVKKIGLKAD